MTVQNCAVPLQLWSLRQQLHWPGPFSKMTWLTLSMAMGCLQVCNHSLAPMLQGAISNAACQLACMLRCHCIRFQHCVSRAFGAL